MPLGPERTLSLTSPGDTMTTASSTAPSSSRPILKFLKVEEYFEGYRGWETIAAVRDVSLDVQRKRIHVHLTNQNGDLCTAEIQFVRKSVLRIRFDPRKHEESSEIHNTHTRAVVMDTMDALRTSLEKEEPFSIEAVKDRPAGVTEVISRDADNAPVLKVRVDTKPFGVTVYSLAHGSEIPMWQTDVTPYYFTPNGADDYRIIQAIKKPATARYFGFGEQGGKALIKNTAQVNFFNF